MKLEKLSLQGFKSFREKTTIYFENGVTGIVGPNGCGKSNIVDALFWVMGEQSAKHLRGDKMSDLIFSGTSKYSASSFAEVTLTLKNTNHKHIHIGQKVVQPEEIELSRKLYRNGETEYCINGLPARLKDIQEVFMDTGAGAKSYSVIAQGEIDRLVRAKPEDRRVMIDEVAGITKFKLRRKESLKKMEQTQQNLDRLSDLQKEVHKQLKDLEEQAGQAKRAKTLREKIQNHNMIVFSHKEHDYLEKYFHLSQVAENNFTLIENLKIENSNIEIGMEDEQLQKLEYMEKVEVAQQELSEISKQLASKEEQLRFFERSLGEKEKQIQERNFELTQIKTEKEQRTNRLQQVQKMLEEVLAKSANKQDYTALEENVSNKKLIVQECEKTISLLQSEKNDATILMQEIENVMYRHQTKIEQLSSEVQEITQEIDLLETQSGIYADGAQNKRESLKELEKKVAELKIQKETTQSEIEKLDEELTTLNNKLQETQKTVVALESKVQSLEEINEVSRHKKGMDTFLKENESRIEQFKILGNLVDSDTRYATALQRTLASVAECLVPKSINDQQELVQWLEQNQQNVDWCFGSDNTAQGDTFNIFDNCISFKEVAKINDPAFATFIEPIFNGRWIVEGKTLEETLQLTKNKKFVSVADMDGKFLIYKKEGLVVVDCNYSDEMVNTGVIDRSIKIKDLNQQLEVAKALATELDLKRIDLVNQNIAKENNLENITEILDKTNESLICLRSELLTQESGFQVGASRLEVLKNKKSEISRQRLALLEQEDEINSQKDAAQAVVKEIVEKIKINDESLSALKQEYENIREQYVNAKASEQSLDHQLENLKMQIEDHTQQLENLSSKEVHYASLVTTYQEEIVTMKAERVTTEALISTLTTQYQTKEQTVSEVKELLDQVLEKVQDEEKMVKEKAKEIARLEKEMVEAKLKCEQILEEEEALVRQAFEMYRINLRSTLMKYLQIPMEQEAKLRSIDSMLQLETSQGWMSLQAKEFTFEKKFPAQVKESQEKARRYNSELNSIGEINWTADEEFERQKVRYSFLTEQETELKKSLEDLNAAIKLIDQKSVIRFEKAYEEINERFSKVFPIIFGGGSASLELTSSPEDPECGVEIVAQPPGKKMQNINLMSGGEKALTAVSLIFSIFLVKPSPFCLLDEVDAPLDDANVGRFNELLREMSTQSQFILITHNKKTMELNDTLYGITMQEPGVSKALSVQLH